MIFIILCVIVALICIGTTWYWIVEEGFIGIVGGLLALMAAGLVGLGLLGLANIFIPKDTVETIEVNYPLKALGTDSQISGGYYFLGGGYINEQRVLNYIYQDSDGSFSVTHGITEKSKIFEEDIAPYVIVRKFEEKNEWLAPFPMDIYNTWEFHIPENSVLENYTIDNS